MSLTEKESIVICGGARTPIGSFLGSLSSLKSHDLGAIVIKEALNRANVEPNEVSQVIMGQVFQTGEGQNPARHASIKAGLGIHTPAYNLNMVCGSGLKAVMLGVQSIRDGDSEIVVCGGMESMSQTPHSVYMRKGVKAGKVDLQDIIFADGLTDAMHQISMGDTSENMAVQFNISRDEQDAIALESQRRASNAQAKGLFDEEIVSVPVKTGIVDKDEFIKPGTTLEGLKKLKPAFQTDGTVTAGNASGLNDGAAAVVIMKEKVALQRGIKPLGRIVSYSSAGCDPKIMGYGPSPAIKLALERAKWTMDEVDIFEINEAFGVVSATLIKDLKLNPEKVNINGGAIALGHPLGSSGTRILVTLLYLLKQQNKKKGVASLCIGGGMGVAMCVERVDA